MLHVHASLPVIDGVITRERLQSYTTVFGCANDSEAMGAYYWNVAMCAALYKLITAVEVSVRNSIDRALRSSLGTSWWSANKLYYKSYVAGVNPPYPVAKLRENFSKAFNSARTEKRKRYQLNEPPTHPEVIAKTDFSTWEYALNESFLGPGLIWPQYLRQVLRGAWPDQSDKKTLRFAREAVADIRALRNRVHHNEPAWKAFGVNNASDAVQYVRGKIYKMVILLELIEPAKVQVLKQSGVIAHAYRIATLEEILRYQKQAEPINLKLKGRLSTLFREDEARVAVVRAQNKRFFLVQPL